MIYDTHSLLCLGSVAITVERIVNTVVVIVVKNQSILSKGWRHASSSLLIWSLIVIIWAIIDHFGQMITYLDRRGCLPSWYRKCTATMIHCSTRACIQDKAGNGRTVHLASPVGSWNESWHKRSRGSNGG